MSAFEAQHSHTEPDPKAGGPDDGRIVVPQPPRPRWLEGALVALLIGSYGSCNLVQFIVEPMAQARVNPIFIVMALFGVPAVLLTAIVIGLYHHQTGYRAAVVDDEGILLGPQAAEGRGVRIRWEKVMAFRITGLGVMLRLQGSPWTRLIGPIIPSRDRQTHEIVVRMEERGIYSR